MASAKKTKAATASSKPQQADLIPTKHILRLLLAYNHCNSGTILSYVCNTLAWSYRIHVESCAVKPVLHAVSGQRVSNHLATQT
jgi:hypothetical protein